jgi:hypothetical protein
MDAICVAGAINGSFPTKLFEIEKKNARILHHFLLNWLKIASDFTASTELV